MLPDVTAIVDGYVVECRNRDTIHKVEDREDYENRVSQRRRRVDLEADRNVVAYDDDTVTRKVDSNYSGKHGRICFKFEVHVTVGGVPFFFRGPVAGSMHDT
eukprot:PhM_4_TR16826/c2_g1_i5/m.47910